MSLRVRVPVGSEFKGLWVQGLGFRVEDGLGVDGFRVSGLRGWGKSQGV